MAWKGGAAVEEPLAYVLTGDGTDDLATLEAICERYDHGAALVCPQYAPMTGLKVIDSLAVVFDKERRTSQFLTLLDREHLKSIDDFAEALEERGFTILQRERGSREGCWRIAVERGGRRGVIILAVQGRAKSIEEDYAELIKLSSGESVEPDKKHIKRWLKERGMGRLRELIRSASVEQLEEAFPSLTCALKALLQAGGV
jgi:hypothetical protein